MLKSLIALSVAALLAAAPASAQLRDFDKYCDLDGYEPAQRETLIVIDSQLITLGENTLEENRPWRERLIQLLNTENSGALNRWAPRERLTVSIAEGDGSGLRSVFSGCMPLYSGPEERDLRENEGSLNAFLTGGWQKQLENDRRDFQRSLTFSLVEGIKDLSAPVPGQRFVESGLGQSLVRGYRPTFQYGVPRLIILTKLEAYDLPAGDTETVRYTGRADASEWKADLGRSEVHILGADGATEAAGKEYLRSIFLASKGNVVTMAGLTGAVLTDDPPASIRVFDGRISYPDGTYPMKLRLALDGNNRAVNSWIEVQSDQIRFVPLAGAVSCTSETQCAFIDAGEFAQVWTDSPGGEPEFENWMPFVGFRDIAFDIDGTSVAGLISDSSGYVPEMEDGLEFSLNLSANSSF
ncbi:MAG: hypothetical protein AAGH87_04555 [Pseudomonadota bacterium]